MDKSTSLTKAAAAVGMINKVASCIEEIDRWMSSNRLKLNSEKTQFIWLGSPQQLSKVGVNQVHLGNHAVTSQSTVCNLGIHLDGQLTMKVHVQRICQTSFYQLRQLWSVRCSLSVRTCTALLHAFVTSRLDYCNSLLAGIRDDLIDQLQTVMQVAARPGPQEVQVRSNLGWHSWSSALAPHPFKNRLQAGSSRLQVSPWYRSCIPYGDACTEINCSGPLPPSLDGERRSSCAENKNKNDWATKLRHFWARPLEQTAWRFEGPFPEFTYFQTKIEIVPV